jgi:NAD-dependent histone deacetylase SIR2
MVKQPQTIINHKTDASPDDGIGLTDAEKKALRSRLRQIGPDKFFEETLGQEMDPRALGTAFGLDPRIFDDDEDTERYIRLLYHAIVRAYYKRRKLTQYNTIEDVAALILRSKNIMVITGAGISTSLGIPDFRSKHTGFYSKIADMGYSEPEEVFDIHNFDEDPSIFYALAGDILPDQQRFSPTHAFIRLLQDNNRLQTNYTQNIDNLEGLAGIHPSRLIQCHGSFATASCRKCSHQVPGPSIFPDIRAKRVPICQKCTAALESESLQPPRPTKRSRSKNSHSDSDADEDDDIPTPGVMKPDITFFGEALPDLFFTRFTTIDAPTTDLVLILGTSLQVAPVSDMPNFLPHGVPHVYVSRERLRHVDVDVQLLGDCDVVVGELCRRLGWTLPSTGTEGGQSAVTGSVPDFNDDKEREQLVEVVQRIGEDGVGEEHVWLVRKKAEEEPANGDKEEENAQAGSSE